MDATGLIGNTLSQSLNPLSDKFQSAVVHLDMPGKPCTGLTGLMGLTGRTDNARIIKDVGINVGINEDAGARVLEYLKENPKASARVVALALGMSSRQVERMIARLKGEGLLLRQGSNKSGTWVALEK